MKILKMCTNRAWGGMEAHMVATSAGLRERGHDVHTACYTDSRIHRELAARDFEPLPLDLWGKLHPLGLLRLARYIRREAIELVHCDFSRDLFTVVPALKLTHRPPLVLQKHVGVWSPKNLPVHTYLYRNVDAVVAISGCIRDNVIANHPVAPERVSVIHPGTDMDRFQTDSASRDRIRREFGLAADDLLIGTIGRLSFAKGHREFLSMAGRIAEEFPRARFVLVGEATWGEDEQADIIHRQADDLALGDRLFFTGYRDDVPDVLSAMDLFVFPTYNEAFGMVIVEAMAAGVAVVTAGTDGVLDIVTNSETGRLIDPRDVDELTQVTAELLQDAALRARLAQRGRDHVRATFTEDQMYRKLESLYESLQPR